MPDLAKGGIDRPIGSWRSAFDVLVGIVLLVAGVVVIWTNSVGASRSSRTLPVPSKPISISGHATLGSEGARLALIEFSDFECGFCGHFAREILPEIAQAYVTPGRVRFVFRHSPLAMHAFARTAAVQAECADEQGRFWQVHDQLFRDQTLFTARYFEKPAGTLDSAAFDACLSSPTSRAKVDEDLADAKALGVTTTPSFLVGAILPDGTVRVLRTLVGALPFASFKEVLDPLLLKQ